MQFDTGRDQSGGGVIGSCRIDFRTKGRSTLKDGFHVKVRYQKGYGAFHRVSEYKMFLIYHIQIAGN